MENNILQNFIEHNNKLVKEWMDNPSDSCSHHIYFQPDCTPAESLSKYGMPEPYLGNPFDCSAVIVNINPGGVIDCNNWNARGKSSNFINKYLTSGSYESYARAFPYLTLPKEELTTNWWESRKEWIEHFSSKKDSLPFAIELCPWHSMKWKGMVYKDKNLKAYINQYVIRPAGEAIKNSGLPFGLAVGKPIVMALEELGFQKKNEWTWETNTLQHWPDKAKGKVIKRCYAFLSHEESNVSFLCTWAQGGNKAPGMGFRKTEKEICEIIKSDIH